MPSHGTAMPPTSAASVSAWACVRLVMTMSPTPCARRCCAVSELISPGADDQHAAPLQTAEDLPRERDRREADRHGAFAQCCLGAHALADAERPPENVPEDRPDTPFVGGRLARILHLAENLRLADHERIEPRRHAKQVRDRGAVFQREQVRLKGLRRHVVIVTEERRRARRARARDLHSRRRSPSGCRSRARPTRPSTDGRRPLPPRHRGRGWRNRDVPADLRAPCGGSRLDRKRCTNRCQVSVSVSRTYGSSSRNS